MADHWYIARGAAVDGPLARVEEVVAAIARDGTTAGSHVWRSAWSAWRPVESLREVQAIRRAERGRSRGASSAAHVLEDAARSRLRKAAALVATASDDLEALTLTLERMVSETRARAGLVHRTDGTLGRGLVRGVVGEGALGCLGAVVERDDEALRAARLGPRILDQPMSTKAGAAAAGRLGLEGVRGVALVPVYSGGALFAVLEIAKHDHPFRRSDRVWLRALSRVAAAKVARHRVS